MTGHTQIRYSWYIPLPHLYTHDNLVNPDFCWIINEKLSKDEIKNNQAIIKNFAKLRYDKTITFPLLTKDNQIRILKEIPFSPIYFATTEQKKTAFEFAEAKKPTTLTEEIIKSVKFSIQLYPFGLGVIVAYINFKSIIKPEVSNHFIERLKCGSKKTSVTKYVQHLKMQLLRSLFIEKELAKVKTICKGPKIRVNFIDDHFNEEKFAVYSDKILGPKNAVTNVLFKRNKKTDDQLAFHKKGLVVFTSKSLSKGRRSYFRKSLDFTMDIFYGANFLLSLMPSIITKVDSKNSYGRINELISTMFLTLNPAILGSKNEQVSLLPTAGMRMWFRLLDEICGYSEEYISIVKNLISRINEMRVDIWYELITATLKENIPIIIEILLSTLKEQNYSIRELVTPKIQLDAENKEIIDFLLERIVTDYSSRFGFSANTQLSKDMLGFCTINIIEKALSITGRNHLEFKNRLDLLSRVGLLEAKAYRGPGSRKDSVQYRASPKYPYVDNYLRMKLAKESISELKLK